MARDTASQTSSELTNKIAQEGYLECWRNPDFDSWDLYFADTVLFNGTPMVPSDLHRLVQFFRRSFSDVELKVISRIAEDDKVVCWGYFEATHTGEFNGIAPTGKHVRWFGCAIDRFAGGQVVECWHEFDTFGLIQQLTSEAER